MTRVSGYLAGYLAGTCIAVALLSAPAAARFIKFQPPGATYTYPQLITNRGEVVGYFYDQSHFHGFVRASDGTITTIDVRGATDTYPAAMRRDGTIVGSFSVGQNHQRGFVRAPDGRITKFQAPHSGIYTDPIFITNTGWIAGTAQRGGEMSPTFGFLRKPNGHFVKFGDWLVMTSANSTHTAAGRLYDGSQWHGFVRTPDGALTQFEPDGGASTDVTAINDLGTVTGTSQIGAIGKGFIRTADGTISTFVAGADAVITNALDINKAGTIVGVFRSKDGSDHGFARAPDGTITIVDVSQPSSVTVLNSINDKGQAVGVFEVNGGTEGFIWKP